MDDISCNSRCSLKGKFWLGIGSSTGSGGISEAEIICDLISRVLSLGCFAALGIGRACDIGGLRSCAFWSP